MLTNGTMFYGRIDHLGSDHPVLRDAFSVREELDSQTQKQRYVLVRRTDAPNGADHMIFPVTSIVLVEPARAVAGAGPGATTGADALRRPKGPRDGRATCAPIT